MRALAFFLLVFGLSNPLLAQTTNDSLQQAANPTHQFSDSAILIQTKKIDHKIDSISQLSSKLTHLTDTLNRDIAHYNRKLDSVKRKLTHRIDSLKRLNLPTAHYTRVLDSLENAGPLKDLKVAEAKLASLERQVNEPFSKINTDINRVESTVNNKLALINQEGGAGANIPGGTRLPNVQLPGVSPSTLPNTNPGLPQASIRGFDSSLPGTTNLLGQNNSVGNLNLQNETNGIGRATSGLSQIEGAPQKEISQAKNEMQLGQIQHEMTQVNGYSKDLKQLSRGNLDSVKVLNQTLEKKAMQLGGADMKQFQSGTNQLTQAEGMAAKGNDPEALKKLAVQEVQKQAIDHFAGKEKELQAAMLQLGKLKQKYSSVSSLSDLKKLSRNQMHGKPLIERIVPGFNLQFQVRNHLLIDFNQQIGYRITKKVTAGAGWNERTGFKSHHFTTSDRIFGPRSFAEFKFTESFAVRGEVEKMNTYVPSLASPNDPGGRRWVWGVFLGLKKEYKFSKYIRGNVQTMYNFMDKNYKTSPYADRFNVRMGFEFPMTKSHR